MALIHHETTTGILNDIKAIGSICGKYEIDMIVDAMSSFAGIPINMDEMNIKYLASSSNKCIQGMAGISFVIVNKESLEKTMNIKPRNLYLNLYKQYLYFIDNYQMRFTPPVQVLYALQQAIIETKEETIEDRYERYKECCKILWKGLDKLKLKKLVNEKASSMLLTSIIEPKIQGYCFDDLHDYLYNKGFTIYPGKVSSEKTFRIANIGQIYPENMNKFIEILEEYFTTIV
jgi:2-aminoethylphosphonate-pyruvate transaminase